MTLCLTHPCFFQPKIHPAHVDVRSIKEAIKKSNIELGSLDPGMLCFLTNAEIPQMKQVLDFSYNKGKIKS